MAVDRKIRQLMDENKRLRLENQSWGERYLALFNELNQLEHSFKELLNLSDNQKEILKNISSSFMSEGILLELIERISNLVLKGKTSEEIIEELFNKIVAKLK